MSWFPWSLLPTHLSSKIVTTNTLGCWLWGAAKTNGYGVVQHDWRVQRAHRVIYEYLRGAIPRGRELDHLCRVRACVNPAHLEPVTGAENIRRGESMSAKHARQIACHRGHPFTRENTYVRKRGHKIECFCRACARLRDAERYQRRKRPLFRNRQSNPQDRGEPMAGRQGQLKGMEIPTGDGELDAFARAFKRSSKKRKAAQDAEIDARSVLIDAMKKKKITLYEDLSAKPHLRVVLAAGDDKVRVDEIDEEIELAEDGDEIEAAGEGEQKASKKKAEA